MCGVDAESITAAEATANNEDMEFEIVKWEYASYGQKCNRVRGVTNH